MGGFPLSERLREASAWLDELADAFGADLSFAERDHIDTVREAPAALEQLEQQLDQAFAVDPSEVADFVDDAGALVEAAKRLLELLETVLDLALAAPLEVHGWLTEGLAVKGYALDGDTPGAHFIQAILTQASVAKVLGANPTHLRLDKSRKACEALDVCLSGMSPELRQVLGFDPAPADTQPNAWIPQSFHTKGS